VPEPARFGLLYKRGSTPIGRKRAVEAAELDIKQWGNSLGVRLPAAVARAARLALDQRVRISVEDGRVIIEPLRGKPLTLADRLARFDPAVHGGEVMASAPVGREAA
jgi:antitoxin MazE